MYQESLYLMVYFKVTLFICWTPKSLYSSCKPSETNCCTVSSTNKIAYKTLISKLILQCIQDNGNQLVKTWSGQRAQQSEQHMSAKCWTPRAAEYCCYCHCGWLLPLLSSQKMIMLCILRRILIWFTGSAKCLSGTGTTSTVQVIYPAVFIIVYVAVVL